MVYLVFKETAKLISKVTAPFYIPTNNIWEIQFLLILTSIWYHHYSQGPRKRDSNRGQFWSRKCSWHRPALTWICSGGYFLCCNRKNKRSRMPDHLLPCLSLGIGRSSGGQFFCVILALGLIFQVRDFGESLSIIWSISCATLFSAWTLTLRILFAKLDFCSADMFL